MLVAYVFFSLSSCNSGDPMRWDFCCIDAVLCFFIGLLVERLFFFLIQ